MARSPKPPKAPKTPKKKYKIPARVAAPEKGFMSDGLLAELLAIAEESAPNDLRGNVLAHVKTQLATAKDLARERFERGRLDGIETARLLAAVHDGIIIGLWKFAVRHIAAENPKDLEAISLCAVGGYGRAEMAPESDVDLLFLSQSKIISDYAKELTEFILYMLWDLGLKVGHATRTVDQCLSLAKEDQTILTSLLDVRHLSGNEDLSETLYRKFRKMISRGKGRRQRRASRPSCALLDYALSGPRRTNYRCATWFGLYQARLIRRKGCDAVSQRSRLPVADAASPALDGGAANRAAEF